MSKARYEQNRSIAGTPHRPIAPMIISPKLHSLAVMWSRDKLRYACQGDAHALDKTTQGVRHLEL